MRMLDRVLSSVERFMMIALTLAGLTMAVVQVVLRYVFNTGIHWLEAGLVTALIWAMLFGASRAIREGYHPRVDLLPGMVGARARAILNLLMLLVTAALCLYYLYDSIFYARFINRIGALHPEIGFKQIYFFIIIPVTMLFFSLRYLMIIWGIRKQADTHSLEKTFQSSLNQSADGDQTP
ncbi:TRAP transporter small permease [Granulosicoccus sp. 3-233]|uniref:TRAP transporter small permease n=1 Tax=Granulosicoccus sp. 3-233 TaxID=3417969 RepID=UPI003D331AB0